MNNKTLGHALVVIPTYNEAENIRRLVSDIFQHFGNVEVLVVDDNSPDRTWSIVEELCKADSRVHLLKRRKKEGLGAAYKAGFLWAFEHGYDILYQMDADFSHEPAYLKDFKRLIDSGYDVVVGSRYVKGGGIVGWGTRRLLLSSFGNLYARLVTNTPIKDLTGGFNCWHSNVLKQINIGSIKSEGYSFLLELKIMAYHTGFKIAESPITFKDRTCGKSKMSSGIIKEAFFRCLALRFIVPKIESRKKTPKSAVAVSK